MSLPAPTLQSFVLNLLTDDAARSAFAANPTAALEGAGLSDVTPEDIREVAPMVADYAPAPAADALKSVLSTLPTGVGADGVQGAAQHLSAIADAAHGLPVSLPDAGAERSLPLVGSALPSLDSLPTGALPVDAPSLDSLPVNLPSLSDLPLNGLPLENPLSSLPVSELPVQGPLSSLPVDAPKADLPTGNLPVDQLGTIPTDELPANLPTPGDLPLQAPELSGLPDAGNLPFTVPTLNDLATNGLPFDVPQPGDIPFGELPLDAPKADLPSTGDLPVNLPVDQLPTNGLPLDAAKADLPVSTPSLPVDAVAGTVPAGLPIDALHGGQLGIVPTDGLPLDAPRADLPADPSGLDGLATNALPVSAPNLGLPDAGTIQTASTTTTDGFKGSLGYSGDAATGLAGAAAGNDSLALAGAADSELGQATGSGVVGTDGAVGAVDADTPAGNYTLSTTRLPAAFDSMGDLGNGIDADTLAKSAPAAGPLADFVSTGGDLVGQPVDSGSQTLSGYLTGVGPSAGPDANAADAVGSAGSQLSDGIHQAGTTISDQAGTLPAHPALPAVPSDLPTASDLPVHASAELPQALSQLPVANPLSGTGDLSHAVTDNPVTDAVSHSPLGSVTAPLDHPALPEPNGLDSLHNDLPFAH